MCSEVYSVDARGRSLVVEGDTPGVEFRCGLCVCVRVCVT